MNTNTSLLTPAAVSRDWSNVAARSLKVSAAAWFVVAILGQAIFVIYLLGFYGRTALAGDFNAWNQVFPHAYAPGAGVHNFAVFIHLAFATLVMSGGALQLLPGLRRRWPAFHRWNGRVYLLSVLAAALAGVVLIVTRVPARPLMQVLPICIDAVLIWVFAFLAYKHARARRIDIHRRWALRLFLAASGVWFFRIGLMFWVLVNHGPVGFDPKSFTGPFISFLDFAQYLLPLAVLEVYLRARDNGSALRRFAVAGGLFTLTLMTATGIFAATMILWLPHL
jgi:hypothetical protein